MTKILSLTSEPLGEKQISDLYRIYGPTTQISHIHFYHQNYITILQLTHDYDILAVVENEFSLELQYYLVYFFANQKKIIRSICNPLIPYKDRYYDAETKTIKFQYQNNHIFWDELIAINIQTKTL